MCVLTVSFADLAIFLVILVVLLTPPNHPKQTFRPDGHAVPGEVFIAMINEMALITVISAAYDTAFAEVTEQSAADHDALTVSKFWPNLHTQSIQLI